MLVGQRGPVRQDAAGGLRLVRLVVGPGCLPFLDGVGVVRLGVGLLVGELLVVLAQGRLRFGR